MQRIALATLLVGLAALQVTGRAQTGAADGAWYTATTYSVKPGMMTEFRQLIIKELNPAAKKGGLTTSQVWRFSTGNTNRVLRIVLHNSLTDRDSPSPVQKGMGAAFPAYQKKLAALIDSSNTYVGRQRLDLGWNPAGSPAPKLADRTTIRVAPGRNAEYMKFVQALLETFKKSGHRRTAGQVVFGGQVGDTFVSNTFYDSWADLAKGRPPTRVLSGADLAAFNALNPPGLFTIISRDVTIYDAEMSVVAAATTSSK